MGERRESHGKKTASYAATVAALACMAGSTQALAQAKKGSASAPSQPPVSAAPSASATPDSPKGNGKLIVQAGPGKASKDALRNPLEKAGNPQGGGEEKVKVDDHMIVDLHVNDEDLANVLQMLSIQSQRNIVTSKNVSAVVTANLYGVTFYEALDAILHVNGYGYIQRGNFIYVYTLDELQKIEEQQRHMVWKVLKLNYLNATDAGEFVKPLLSEHGQIKVNGKTSAYQVSSSAPSGADDFAEGSTMMVFDYEENLAEIEKVVKEMDTRPAQVLVEATILQTTLNEANAFGVDFSVIGDLNFTNFVNIGGPLKAVDGLISGNGSSGGSGGSSGGSSGSGGSGGTGGSGGSASTGTPLPNDNRGGAVVSTPGNVAGGPATMKLGIVWNDVAAFVRMLDEVSDTTIISRPNVLTLNRQSAYVLVGRKVGYLNTTSTDTATTQTVEFLDTGTQLHFRPFVSDDGMIRMELKPKVSEAVIRNVTASGGAAVTIPDEISNELTTNVMVRDGQTIVLGGLFREETDTSRKQVPGIGDVPIIGAAFRGHDDSTVRSEIIFMITPSIVSDQVLLDQGKRGEASVERIRAGTREGLLPWSREKRTQQLVVQATELAQQGKRDEALYKVQRALTMNHNQPDAIELREQLLGQQAQWPTKSLQHEVVTGELEKELSATHKQKSQFTPAPAFNRPVSPAPAPAPQPAKTNLSVTNTGGTPETTPSTGDPSTTDNPEDVLPNLQPDPNADPSAEPTTEPGSDPNGMIDPSPDAAATSMMPTTGAGDPFSTGVEPSGTEPNGEPSSDPFASSNANATPDPFAPAGSGSSGETSSGGSSGRFGMTGSTGSTNSGLMSFRGFWGIIRTFAVAPTTGSTPTTGTASASDDPSDGK